MVDMSNPNVLPFLPQNQRPPVPPSVQANDLMVSKLFLVSPMPALSTAPLTSSAGNLAWAASSCWPAAFDAFAPISVLLVMMATTGMWERGQEE